MYKNTTKNLQKLSLALCLMTSHQLLFAYETGSKETDMPVYAIAIHGGAGTILKKNLTEAQQLAYESKLVEARDAGFDVLNAGGSSQKAVITAINILEDSPLFNAGVGSVYTYDQVHELDASVMDGKTKNAGAVSGVKKIKNPINLANDVMENSVHVMLSGNGAEDFASTLGYAFINNSIFDTKRRLESLNKAKDKMKVTKNWPLIDDFRFGTVGAVALDKDGNLFAGTSTGGMTAKRWGRIGDAPIIGAGTYADNNSCAVSATGHGEFFIRYNVAADICARVKYKNETIEQAGRAVIFGEMFQAGGTGGVIIIDTKGNISMPFNTAGMYRASKSSIVNSSGNLNESATVAIFK